MMRMRRAVLVALAVALLGAGLGAPAAHAAPGNTIEGTVHGGLSGLPGATVTLIQGSTVVGTTTTDATGGYGFSGLGAGTYYTIGTSPGFLPAWAGLSVLATHTTVTYFGGFGDVAVVDLTLPITFCTPGEGGPFNDVSDTHAFCMAIDWAAYGGLVQGFPDSNYRPGNAVTRQAQAAIIYRYYGEPTFDPPATPTFTDVGTGHPFRTEIEWLYASGLATGFGDGTFRPTASITRQAMTAFLYRMAGSPFVLPPVTGHFSDVPHGHAFYNEIEWAYANNLVIGFDGGTFRPGSPVTRQALASLLFRYDGNYPAFFPSGPPS